jgi:hypothetical protein
VKITTRPDITHRASTGPRLLRIIQRVVVIVALLHVAIGAWFLYRTYLPVRALDLKVMSENLRPGLPTVVRVVTSGSEPVEVRLELTQGDRSVMLATLRVSQSRHSFYDPRPHLGSMTPSFTPEFLAQFQEGPAVLRATAIARPRWLITPRPSSQAVAVIVAPPGNDR